MAADETDPLSDPARRKRSRAGRTPPVIEGEAVAVESAPAVAPEPARAPEQDAKPKPAVAAQAPSPASPTPATGAMAHLPLAAAVLLGALGLGAGLYGASEAQKSASDVMELRAQVAGLHARPAASAVSPDQLAAAEQRIAVLEQRLAAPRPAEPVAAPAAPAEIRVLGERVSAAEAAARTAIQTANRAAEASARPIPPPVDLQPLDKRLAALEAREAPLATMAKRTEAAGLAVVAQSIAQALDQGAPFESSLAAAASLGADPARLAPLQAIAKTGAPTTRSLARLWAEESRAALDALREPESDQGWLDRLKAGASRVVRVRPVGEAAGEDPAALCARIEAALGRGAAPEALADWTKLPEPARAASRSFGEAARQHVAAQEAAKALTSGAVADLARSKGAP